MELLEKLAALIPRPYVNLIVYHGVLAPNAKWRGEVVDFGFGEREILVRHSFDGPTKAGKVRRIPMLPPVFEALAAWQRRDDVTRAAGLVFHARDGAMHAKGYDSRWAKKWRSAAAIRPEVRFHDLRHACASHLVMGTWGRAWRLEEFQVVLGHASRTTTPRLRSGRLRVRERVGRLESWYRGRNREWRDPQTRCTC